MDSSEGEETSSSSGLDEAEIIDIDKKNVERAFKMIVQEIKKDQKRKRKRKGEDTGSKVDTEPRSDCSGAQLNTFILMPTDILIWVKELRAFLIRQDFTAASKCVYELLDRRLETMPVLWKVSSIILLNHPNLTVDLVKEFLQMNCGLLLPEDMQLFLQQIFKLPNSIIGNFNEAK